MKKFKVVYREDLYDEWGVTDATTVEYILADSKKNILACFDENELEELDVHVYTEKEAIAVAKKELAKTISEFKKSKGSTLDDLGWDPVENR